MDSEFIISERTFEDEKDTDKKNKLREELENLLNKRFPLNSVSYRKYKSKISHKSETNIKMIEESASNLVCDYVLMYCAIKGFICGVIKEEYILKKLGVSNIEALFEGYDYVSQRFATYTLSDTYIRPVANVIKKEMWKICKEKKDVDRNDCSQIVEKHFVEFLKKVSVKRDKVNEEFDIIESRNFEGTDLECVSSNVENISDASEEIMKNLVAMILKIESEEFKNQT